MKNWEMFIRNRNIAFLLVFSGFLFMQAFAVEVDYGDSGFGERCLRFFDDNGDGLITMEEFRPPKRDHDRLNWMDSDSDGDITHMELLAAEERILNQTRRYFDKLDVNRDGVVTMSERHANEFRRVDRNGDEFLDSDELRRAKLRKERERRRVKPNVSRVYGERIYE